MVELASAPFLRRRIIDLAVFCEMISQRFMKKRQGTTFIERNRCSMGHSKAAFILCRRKLLAESITNVYFV